MVKIYFILFLIFVYITNIYAYKIYMIRHGEKIDDKHIGLSKIGKIRSKSISRKFSNSKYNISKIYVQQYHDDGGRKRAYDTIKPLADNLNIKIDSSCERDPIKCIINKILNNYKKENIFIVWEHDYLQKIAEKLISELNIQGKDLKHKLSKSNKGYNFLWLIENNR